MICHEVRALLSQHLDDELVGPVAIQVDAHLRVCGACHHEWETLRQSVLLVGKLGRLECPEDLRPPVAAAIDDWSPARAWLRWPSARRARRVIALAAAAAVVIVGGVLGLGRLARPVDQIVERPLPPRTTQVIAIPVGSFSAERAYLWHEQFNYQQAIGPQEAVVLANAE